MALSDHPSDQRHTGESTQQGYQGYTERERDYVPGGQTIRAGRGFLSEATEATEDLATTAVRGVVGVGENIIQGVGRLATDGVIEVSRLLVTAAGGLRGAIGTIVTGRPPRDIPWLNIDEQQQDYQGYQPRGRAAPSQSQRQSGTHQGGTQQWGTSSATAEGQHTAQHEAPTAETRPPTI